MSSLNEIIPYKEGFVRLGAINMESCKESYPNLTETEVNDAKSFVKEMILLAKQCVQEYAKEQGYEFVSTGKGKERVLVKKELVKND